MSRPAEFVSYLLPCCNELAALFTACSFLAAKRDLPFKRPGPSTIVDALPASDCSAGCLLLWSMTRVSFGTLPHALAESAIPPKKMLVSALYYRYESLSDARSAIVAGAAKK